MKSRQANQTQLQLTRHGIPNEFASKAQYALKVPTM